jgi:hypothetical protein
LAIGDKDQGQFTWHSLPAGKWLRKGMAKQTVPDLLALPIVHGISLELAHPFRQV